MFTFLTVLQAKLLDRPLYVSLIVNCILLVVLLIVTIVWRTRRANVAQETEQTICERCTNLFTDGAIPTWCQKNGTDTCCCQASLVINAFVKKVRSFFFLSPIIGWLVGWLIDSIRPCKQFFNHVGTEPPLPGCYQYFWGANNR